MFEKRVDNLKQTSYNVIKEQNNNRATDRAAAGVATRQPTTFKESRLIYMLKTNSRKARENLRAYIQKNFDCSNYTDTEPETFPQMCAMIFETFQAEKFYSMEYIKAHRMTELQVFEEWCAGLPSILDTCYYYNRSAVDDLGDILEQTEQQRNKYNERAAEKLLTSLIYRTIKEGALK